MGTPEFAVNSLDILVKNNYNIVGVITATDKLAGRGNQLTQSAVKKYAVEHNLHILQPEKLKDEVFLADLKALNADLQIVVAFRMLPEVVWNMPRLGTFNLHASLLPQYRGAAPINWAVINGETKTGVSTFFLQQEIDTGNIIFQSEISIDDDDNAGDVHDKLMDLGAHLVLKTVMAIEKGKIIGKPQELSQETKNAPKIFKTTYAIDWQNDAISIHNLIRGLSPFPTAFTLLNGKIFKVFKAKINKDHPKLQQGEFKIDSTILVGTATDNIELEEIQIEGKRRMSVKDFLVGYKG